MFTRVVPAGSLGSTFPYPTLVMSFTSCLGSFHSSGAEGYGVRIRTTEGVSDSQVKCPSGSQGVVFPSLSLSLPVGFPFSFGSGTLREARMNGENDEPHGGGQEPTRETKGTRRGPSETGEVSPEVGLGFGSSRFLPTPHSLHSLAQREVNRR